MRSLVIGTAGHIDHGKSALVKALTGTDPDRLKEEQERGITIDLGFAHLALDDLQVAFVDVPGHERFVRNMLAGAGGIDAVLLVVAADESVMPQTREHFDICRLLGIERGVVVLTKSDLVDADTIELVALDVRELVAGSFLQDAPVLPVSAKTGAGLDALRGALRALANVTPRQARAGVVRLPVDRVFTVKGFGTVVTGTLVSGVIREGDELTLLPGGRSARVRGIQVHGRRTAVADAPRRVALNLGAIEVGELGRGVTLSSAGALSVTRRVDARLSMVAGARPLRHGARVRVHHGTDEVLGRVALAAVADAPRAEWEQVRAGEGGAAVPPGGTAYVRIRLERPAVFTRGDRVVVRAYSPPRTIAGAIVLDPEPPSSGVRRPSTFERFKRLDQLEAPPEAGHARVWLAEAGLRGIDEADLVRRGGASPAQAAQCVAQLGASAAAVLAGGRAFDATRASAMEQAIVRNLTSFHDAHPLETGMPREALRELVAPGGAPELFEAVLNGLSERRVAGGTERVGLQSRSPTLDPATARARDAVDRLMLESGLMPPDASAIRSAAGLAGAPLDEMIRLLLREQRLVRVGPLLFHAEALKKLRREVQAMKLAEGAGRAEIDVATFKTRYGLSRKFAIPLLEWLDKERVTRRVGEKRVVL